MLLGVRCDKESFKEVRFEPGFNVILADRTKESTKRDSRNGLGKSALIQIIHFCLGGKSGKTLSNKQLENWTFTLDIELRGKKYSISRNTKKKNSIIIDGDCSSWPIKPESGTLTGNQVMHLNDWKRVLGVLMFRMQLEYPDLKYVPTFRSCISYFARQNSERGGFLDPFSQYRSQLEWDKQVNNAFLLGLDWVYASKWQILKDRKKVLKQIKTEAESGILKYMVGSIGELEARKIRLGSDIQKQEEELKSFQVHPQYHRIERKVNEITAQIHDMVNKNVSDKNLLQHYENSIKEEKDASVDSIERMYNEVGIIMPDNVKRRIEDVNEFHKKIVVNRKEFLTLEINGLKQMILQREDTIRNISEKRSKLFNILKTHKALDEYTQLQQHNLELVSELKDITNRIENLKRFEQGQSALKIDLELLQQQARISLNERKDIKEKAINFFNSNSQALYESHGILSIDISPTGYLFNVDIEREGSHGIGNMKIFCYDLMLAQLWADREGSPDFLIHDSILFADVDERQIALALELASRECKDKEFQYICTMNSDNIPYNDFSEDFNLKEFVSVTLTDANEDGCLFGIRF